MVLHNHLKKLVSTVARLKNEIEAFVLSQELRKVFHFVILKGSYG